MPCSFGCLATAFRASKTLDLYRNSQSKKRTLPGAIRRVKLHTERTGFFNRAGDDCAKFVEPNAVRQFSFGAVAARSVLHLNLVTEAPFSAYI